MFKLSSKAMGGTAAFEYHLGTASEAYSLGETLKFANGALTKASGEDIPLFICQRAVAAEATPKTQIPVMRVMPNQQFETTFSVAATGLGKGSLVTIAADGLQVTATDTDGVFRISGLDGTAEGSNVRGYFDPSFARPGDIPSGE